MPWFLGNRFMHPAPFWVGYSVWGLVIFLAWSAIWKGIALWHAAKRGEKFWFIGLFVINTMGILEICYLLFVVKFFSHEAPKHTRGRKK